MTGRSHRDLLSAADLDQNELGGLLTRALEIKQSPPAAPGKGLLAGRMVALLFEKPSLRTRVSFEVAAARLGASTLYLSPQEVGLGKRETVEDAALTLSRLVDALVIRTFDHATLEELARHADVAVINALTDAEHPCQAFADLLTVLERRGSVEGARLAFIGDGNNVAISLGYAAVQLGASVVVAAPDGYEVPKHALEKAAQLARGGAEMKQVRDPVDAVAGADVIYTDVWTSMGQEAEGDKRRREFTGYRVDQEMLQRAHPDAFVMHCLPAHYDEEIEHAVAHGPRSAIFDQAENRLHAQQALLELLLG